MKNETVSQKERIEEVLRAVETETGMMVSSDRYPCFLRVGDNWSDYPFNWEPFRDLSGPLKWPENAPLIVMISTKEALNEPLIETYQEPRAHNRIKVSPGIPVAAIVEQWIAQIAGYLPTQTEPKEFFLKGLELKPNDVSPEVLRFLGLESAPKKKPIALSATVKGIAKDIGGRKVSAFEIAEMLKEKHGEYASHRLGEADWDTPDNPATNGWDIWRDSVAKLYDEDAVSKSHHKVIDGRLFLVGLGLYANPLRDALAGEEVWAPLLLEIDEAVIQPSGHLRDALNEIQLAHGYQCDRPDGDDQLGIQGEVNAVCEVIMDPEVKPPLAIGLFGSWGSGKSFFMEKMRERVYNLTRKPQKNRPKKVIQIRFNAWHYADTSLWASLAVEIFERLADPEPIPTKDRKRWLKNIGDPNRDKRENLITNLETYRQAKAALEREREHLETEQERLSEEREKAERARKTAIESATFTNVAAELIKDQEIVRGLSEISSSLGMKPAVDQLISIANELQTASGYITATWRKIENKNWTVGLLVTAIVLLVFTATVKMAGTGAWFGSLIPAIGSIATAVMASSKHILPAVKNVNDALKVVSSTVERVTLVEEELLSKRSKEEQALELELAAHNEQIEEATRSIAALNEKIAKISAEADALSVGRRLYDFLADRAAGYKKHQGVVGMLHRDFLLLNAQLMAQSPTANNSGLPKIDRVVLYIDDLDRCPPEKVLEVLEAVHLLLALELFIVVVGVDPSWLQRSLRHQYRDLCLSKDPSNDPYLHAMPIEYLEKIFQIPLTLPAMEAKGYRKLISSLSPKTALPPTKEKPETSVGPTRRAASPESPGGSRAPTRSLLEVQVGSAAHGTGAKTIDLTSDEVIFIQQLGSLVDTPRAAKRLMNTYRLIRATQHVGSRSRFLGTDGEAGEYYAVLTLLAIAAGFPALVDRVLVKLEEDPGKSKTKGWQNFVNKLDPNKKKKVTAENASQNDEDPLSQADEAEWVNMYNGLKESINSNKLHDIEPYQRWGRTVARFSFTL
jgi:hypothetical protein